MADSLEVRDLTKTFHTRSGDVAAVRGVSFTLGSGEVVAVLGPNGAGKTTTLDCVLGLTAPTSGDVRVLGTTPRDAVDRGAVSAVLQTGGLLRDVSVRETAQMIASTYAHPAPVDDVLERAGIAHLARRRVSKCSGGEQQRLKFALALLPDPELVVLDEPTAGMDVGARRSFWDTMHADAHRGRTVVFATHYLEEAESFADRIVLIAGGKVVADGPTEQIRARSLARVVSARVADVDAAVAALNADPRVTNAVANGARVSVTATDADGVALALLTTFSGHDLEVAPPRLEDAFLELTQEA